MLYRQPWFHMLLRLCDFTHVPLPPWAFISHPVKWLARLNVGMVAVARVKVSVVTGLT